MLINNVDRDSTDSSRKYLSPEDSSRLLEGLVDRYSARLYNLAFRYIQSAEEAEEVVQEVFLRAFQALPRLDLRQPPEFWLFRVAINLCRDWARKKREVIFSELTDSGEDALDFDDGEISPEGRVEQKESEARLQAAVNDLADAERLVITMRYNENLTYQQIADILDIPVSTVGTYLFRARKNLIRILRGNPGEER